MSRRMFFVLVLAIFLTGCAGATPSDAGATEIAVKATDFAYSPSSITVPVGQPVTITLDNEGTVEHDFVVDKISVEDVEASENGPAMHHQMGEMPDYDLHFYANAGDSAVLKFTAMEPGTYEIYCTIKGHKEAGMIGTLIVVDQG
jgi:uncharacterized cupredoxin-like copper-binding protein